MLNFLKVNAFDFAKIFGNVSKKWYYYVTLLIVLSLIVLCIVFSKKKKNTLSGTRLIVYVALCSALCFMANYFTVKASDLLQISFVALAGFIAGYLLGGAWGFVAAFIGDLLCGIIKPFGAYNPIIGIGNGTFGLIPGIIFSVKYGNDIIKVIISATLTFICCSFFINTLGLSLMYTMTFESLLVQLPYKLITAVVNGLLCIAVVKIFPKILPKNFFSKGDKNENRT